MPHTDARTDIYIYLGFLCEVFVVRNFNFLLVWIICSHIHSFRLLLRLHLQHGVFQHCAICIDCALAYAGYLHALHNVYFVAVIQISTATAAAAGIDAADAKDKDIDPVNEESTDSRPLTPAERNLPSTTDDSRKTPTSFARSEEAVQPVGSE